MKKKILLAVLIVMILLGVGVAYAYFATDAFKTEKEMFFSYIMEENMLENLQDEKLTQYLQKQETTPYTNKGEITLEISEDEILTQDESVKMLNNSKVTIEGKTDVSKKLTEQKLTLDMGQGFNIPVNLRMAGETIGIQSNFLNSKYIAVRNENLNALFTKFGLETEGIPDKLELSKEEFTEEEIKSIEDKYFAILNENLGEELFGKEKINKQTIVTLKMSEQKVIDILIKILETARNDELILDKLPENYAKEDIKTKIDEMIDELKETETDEANTFEIKLYVENKDVKKCEVIGIEDTETVIFVVIENTETEVKMKMQVEGEQVAELSIAKETTENDTIYTMSINVYDEIEGDVQIIIEAQYNNLSVLDNVQENYEIKMLYDETDMTINYDNLTTFTSVDVEELNEDNAIILNDATEQELQNLLISIYQNLGLM